jgi:hypothetical protein
MVLVINEGKIIERGTHKELMEMKGFYYRVYMSQFKGTNGDVETISLLPAEASAPQLSLGGMGHMNGSGMAQQRIMEIVEVFRKKGATSPESALALKELEDPPMFGMVLQGSAGQSGIFLEHNGKYYISEDRYKRMQERFGSK